MDGVFWAVTSIINITSYRCLDFHALDNGVTPQKQIVRYSDIHSIDAASVSTQPYRKTYVSLSLLTNDIGFYKISVATYSNVLFDS